MATNTSNLALTKAADGEAYSVSVVNQNLQKIDDFAGDLIHENKGSVSSLSALSTLLDTVLVALGNNKTKTFIVGISASSAPFGAATYSCTIYKFNNDTTYSHAILRRADAPYVYSAARNSNGWTYRQLSGVPIVRPSLTDAESGITQNGYYIVDQSSRTVRVYCAARASRDILSTEALAVIPAPYKPVATSSLVGIMVGGGGQSLAYFGTVDTNGVIKQAAGNTMREVFLTGEYQY